MFGASYVMLLAFDRMGLWSPDVLVRIWTPRDSGSGKKLFFKSPVPMVFSHPALGYQSVCSLMIVLDRLQYDWISEKMDKAGQFITLYYGRELGHIPWFTVTILFSDDGKVSPMHQCPRHKLKSW